MHAENPVQYLDQMDTCVMRAIESVLSLASTDVSIETIEKIRASARQAQSMDLFALAMAPIVGPGLKDTHRINKFDAHVCSVIEGQGYGSPGEHVANSWSLEGPFMDVRSALDELPEIKEYCAVMD